jgi:NAD(P)H-dependent flavin oxidoreductase YrpB (nitropropane dioxygenase family)
VTGYQYVLNNKTLNRLNSFILGDLLIPFPIIQGGMGIGIPLSGLASPVANPGGI